MTVSKNKHSKKRNSLLIYEFLVRTISRSLIEDDKTKSTVTLKILRKYYKPGTEIYKEFRLMNALAKTTVSSEHVASSILKEAKTAVNGLDVKKLDREKSLLIRDINHKLNEEHFYDQHVPQYRNFASIQTLINEWNSSDKDLQKIAQFEDMLMSYLITEKAQPQETSISEDSSGTARLLMKVMTKKLNEKYNGVLNDQQKSLIKAYAYSTASDDSSSIKKKLEEIRSGVINRIDEELSKSTIPGDYIKTKLNETKAALINEDLTQPDDSIVSRFMLYSKLHDELTSEEE